MCVMIGSPGKRIPKNSYVFCIIQYRFSTDEEKWGKSGRVRYKRIGGERAPERERPDGRQATVGSAFAKQNKTRSTCSTCKKAATRRPFVCGAYESNFP